MVDEWPGDIGTATMHGPADVTVDSYQTVSFVHRVGHYGIDDGGGLMVLLAMSFDGSVLQGSDPQAPGFVTVETDSAAKLRLRFGTKLYERPWLQGVAVDVVEGSLAEGELITVTLGATGGGSPGLRMQTYADPQAPFKVVVDPFATGRFLDLAMFSWDVRSAAATALEVIARHRAPGILLNIKARDKYGNPAIGYDGSYDVYLGEDRVATGRLQRGLGETVVPATGSGVARFRVCSGELEAEANPVFLDRLDEVLWGDTQGQTGETVGAGTVEDFLCYARDVAALDFVTHSANDFQITKPLYRHILEATDSVTTANFVAFAGFEWSGNTPVGGDHNVLFPDNQNAPLHRSSHALLDDVSDVETDCTTCTELYQALRAEGTNAVCVAHVGGRRANPRLIETDMTPVLEIVSVHGWFDWFARDALRAGLKVGFVGASDDHTGRPGASYPTKPAFGTHQGMAAIQTQELTREGVLSAMRRRATYATTGPRILLTTTCNGVGGGGDIPASDKYAITVEAHGTAGIEKIVLVEPSGRETELLNAIATEERSHLRVSWRGARSKDRFRWQTWDGKLTVSGTQIKQAEAWAFERPEQGIVSQSDTEVAWRSTTSGDVDGVVLQLSGEPSEIAFEAGEVQLAWSNNDLRQGVRQSLPDGVEREVSAQWIPAQAPAASVRVTRELALEDINFPCYVRVHQADGNIAWASPFFVDQGN